MVIDQKRRDMFVDLYRVAEYYEKPPFKPGDVDGNAKWFEEATEKVLAPFLKKHVFDDLALELVSAILNDANRQAVEANKAEVI